MTPCTHPAATDSQPVHPLELNAKAANDDEIFFQPVDATEQPDSPIKQSIRTWFLKRNGELAGICDLTVAKIHLRQSLQAFIQFRQLSQAIVPNGVRFFG